MEFEDKMTQLEEVSIDKVCRTCLSTSDELMITLFDEDEEENTNYLNMITICFGKILPSHENLPTKLCSECLELIKKSFEFRSRCTKATEILIGNFNESKQFTDCKETQTEEQELHFDDAENFEGIHLHGEDEIFEAQDDVFQQSNSQIEVKSEGDFEALDEHYEEVVNEQKERSNDKIIPSDNDFPLITIEKCKKAHKCEKCPRSFARLSHLRKHILSHNDKSLKCLQCDKIFSQIEELNDHIASNNHQTITTKDTLQSTSKTYPCVIPECNKNFQKEEQLKKHVESKHSDQPNGAKEYCSICNKYFSSKKYLRSHMKVHNNEKNISIAKKDPQHEKPYLCSECGLRFVRNDYLVIHMRRHLGLKPYKCKFCDKGFPRATDLTVHERYHTNEKTHLCNLCGKGFQRAYNLLVHMRVHTGEKPYECNYCSKSFSQGNDLKAHIRRHTGERFKCDLCSEGFIQGYHLTHHKRTIHGLDVKSHIRRVEKFSVPVNAEIQDGKQINSTPILNEEHSLKIETDFQEVLMN